MNKVMIAPRRYVQGAGVLKESGSLISAIAKKALILWDPVVKGIVGDTLLSSLKESGVGIVDVKFNGQSSKEEAARVAEELKKSGAEVAIAVGGGKTLDTAKAAAATAGAKTVTIPTIASNDSPTSSFTVWYDEKDGSCLGFESWGVNPDIVIVDTEVIANGPARAFVAGMGDALGTWVEAEACSQSGAGNLAGGKTTLVTLGIAKLAYDVLMENGVAAMNDVKANKATEAVEKVTEANVLMSGLGFESVGVATAHAIANSLPAIPECHHLMHGEEVGFGIITQLCLDPNFDDAERNSIVDWEIAVGLPVTFADIGLKAADPEKLKVIAEAAVASTLCNNHPFEVTTESLIAAMIAADKLGNARK